MLIRSEEEETWPTFYWTGWGEWRRRCVPKRSTEERWWPFAIHRVIRIEWGRCESKSRWHWHKSEKGDLARSLFVIFNSWCREFETFSDTFVDASHLHPVIRCCWMKNITSCEPQARHESDVQDSHQSPQEEIVCVCGVLRVYMKWFFSLSNIRSQGADEESRLKGNGELLFRKSSWRRTWMTSSRQGCQWKRPC